MSQEYRHVLSYGNYSLNYPTLRPSHYWPDLSHWEVANKPTHSRSAPTESSGWYVLLILVPIGLLVIALVVYRLCVNATKNRQFQQRGWSQTQQRNYGQPSGVVGDGGQLFSTLSSSSSEEEINPPSAAHPINSLPHCSNSKQQQPSVNPEFSPSAPPLLETSKAEDLPPSYEVLSLYENCAEATAVD